MEPVATRTAATVVLLLPPLPLGATKEDQSPASKARSTSTRRSAPAAAGSGGDSKPTGASIRGLRIIPTTTSTPTTEGSNRTSSGDE